MSKDYKIKYISDDDFKILHSCNVYKETCRFYDGIYFYCNLSNCRVPYYIYNKNTIDIMLDHFKNGGKLEDKLIKDLFNKSVNGECWEFDKLNLKSSCRRGKRYFSYCKTPWADIIKERKLVSETDEFYIFIDIPNGQLSNGFTKQYKFYKSVDHVKKSAITYIDSQIDWLNEFKEYILTEQ